jgi:hypothetical protein
MRACSAIGASSALPVALTMTIGSITSTTVRRSSSARITDVAGK